MKSKQEIIYNCKNATFLIEKELETILSVTESTELTLHLTGCSVCRLYQSQTSVISAKVKQILNNHQTSGLDSQFKTGLQNQIDFQKKNQNNSSH